MPLPLRKDTPSHFAITLTRWPVPEQCVELRLIHSNPNPAFEASCASRAAAHVHVIASVALPVDVRRIRQPRLWLTLCACMPAHPAARAWICPRACTDPAHLFHMGANSGQDAEIATTGARLLSPTHERHSCRCRVNAGQCVLVSLRGGRSKIIFGTRLR